MDKVVDDKITIDISTFISALKGVSRIEDMTSDKANVGYKGKWSVEDSYALSIACIASAAYQDLMGYLSEDDRNKVLSKLKFEE